MRRSSTPAAIASIARRRLPEHGHDRENASSLRRSPVEEEAVDIAQKMNAASNVAATQEWMRTADKVFEKQAPDLGSRLQFHPRIMRASNRMVNESMTVHQSRTHDHFRLLHSLRLLHRPFIKIAALFIRLKRFIVCHHVRARIISTLFLSGDAWASPVVSPGGGKPS